MSTILHEVQTPQTPQSPLASLWLQINLAVLAILLLLFGVFHAGRSLFNELMMIVGAYNFTFILLYWVLFVDNFINEILVPFLSQHILKRQLPQIPRSISVVIAYGSVILFVIIFALAAYPSLSHQVVELKVFIPKALNSIETLALKTQKSFNISVPGLFVEQLSSLKASIVSGLVNLGSKSVAPLLYILLGQLISLYLLFDGAALSKFVRKLLPSTRRNRLSRGIVLSQVLMFRAIRAFTITAMLSSILMYGLFKLLLIPYAGLFTVFYGVCCFVPVLGQWIGLLFPVIYLLAKLQLGKLLVLGILAGLYHYIRSRFITPQLFDRRYRLHPLVILIGIQMCIDVAGLWGFLLLVPLTVLIVTVKRLFFPRSQNIA